MLPGGAGFVIVGPGLPIPARITGKVPGRSWDWRVGPVDMRHAVTARDLGCEVRIELDGPGTVELTLRASYGPLIALLVRNLARVAN